ncbi:MAG: DUF2059 domain-containing protein [Hyphomicrobiales bacterium]|nr:DUF2059 domain-containing protein [Hyphomicrobiales bacterium]
MLDKVTIAGLLARATGIVVLALMLIAGGEGVRAEPKAKVPPEPSASAIKIAREILDLKNSGYLFQPMVPGVIERVRTLFLQTSPTLRKDIDDVTATLQKVFAPRYNELMNDIAWVYASRFSEGELKEIVTFYRTPTGRKLIQAEPQVFDDAMNGLKVWQEKFAEEVIARFRAEMKKRGHDL